ncbi:hypothetical protein HanXRQr2_Chr09g0385481 [Helianthus annuus]|uniref:Uncharacterized protein n=1 Tax=Helianthus annuus TaxID=4232 RepID=A0A9K3I5G1_HELAN|nr:hypothetical protein HanXRQr2_Chr09g0385481 [Helianthus annuus]
MPFTQKNTRYTIRVSHSHSILSAHRAALSPGDSKGDLGFLLAMQDLAFSMTPDQRISLYTTPNRLSLKVVKGLDLPISDV